MKIKKIKKLLEELYMRGIGDGIDIVRRPHDRFLGNMSARRLYENERLEKAYQELKKLI
ncbi:MAG TPA: hypothetical protein VF941_14245 [Clostridia bacterium]